MSHSPKSSWANLWPYRGIFWKYRYHYALGATALVATNVLQLSIPQLLKTLVEKLQAGQPYAGAVGLVIVITIVLFGIRIVSRLFTLNTSRKIEYELLDLVYQKLQRLPMSFYLRQHTGDLMSRASNDVRLIRSLSGFGMLSLVNLLCFAVLSVSFMMAIDWELTLAALAPFILLLGVLRALSGRLRDATIQTQAALARLSSLIQENLSGIGVAQANQMEGVLLDRFQRENDAYLDAALGQTRARSLMMPFMSFSGGLSLLVVLALGGRNVVNGAMGLGEFVAFQAYMAMLLGPTIMMGWTLSLFQRGLAAFERMTQLLETPETLAAPAAPRHVEITGALRARGLGFAYGQARRPSLVGVDFDLAAGRHLGLVGPVGSGKTTLLRLVARQLEVEPGRLWFDGVDATELTAHDVRAAMGLVPQDDFLFSATIHENIAFGRPETDAAEVRRVADLVRLHAEIERFPDGYAARVGERGITLSGGQRQRVALARALLRRPRLLVLDDALSKVDAETASEILRSLREAWSGMTVLIASHRVADVQQAHEILVLREGSVVERGEHAALLESSEFYKDMAWRQRLQSEVEALR